MKSLYLVLFTCWLCSCSTDKEKVMASNASQKSSLGEAKVTKVSVSGDANSYTLNVTIESPDTGCDQYADWWEVIDLEGNLMYRRILAHSHVTEQPFTRSGSDIEITANTQVYVRAHMNTSGYGTQVQKGSVEGGFIAVDLDVEFAKDLEKEEPLPSGCAF